MNTPHKTDALDMELERKIFKMVIEWECDVCDKSTRPEQVAEWIAFIQTHYLSREAVREAIPKKAHYGDNDGLGKGFSRGFNTAIKQFEQALGLEGDNNE